MKNNRIGKALLTVCAIVLLAAADISTAHAVDIHTASGGVTAYLPQTPGFTAQIETTSGRFESQLALTKRGNAYIAGDGSGTVKIHTTSGNILVNTKESK